jgi:pimeloyl-ACP methyl ester carboxylesterase
MGSRLVDARSRETVWGLRRILGTTRPWRGHSDLRSLHVDENERAGVARRLKPEGIIALPFYVPVLGGLEPYGRLIGRLREVNVYPGAVQPFAYDWRLSVRYNANLLAEAMYRHLAAWREHPEHAAARRAHPEQRDAQLVLVAHSMGGLLVRALSLIPGAMEEVRAVVTLGTPFHGSVKAVELLATGEGGPFTLSRKALREAAATMPGVHDLLPSYRCMLTPDGLVAPTSADLAQVGADIELTAAAQADRDAVAGTMLPRHRLVAGIAQPTQQSFEIEAGSVRTSFTYYRRHPDGELVRDCIGRPLLVDHSGDGTVYRYAASLEGVQSIDLAQQHAALARMGAAADIAAGVSNRIEDLGAVLGPHDLGMAFPNEALIGMPVELTVHGAADPAALDIAIDDALTDEAAWETEVGQARPAGEQALTYEVKFTRPGIFRVGVSGGGEPVTKLVEVSGLDDDG